MSKIPDKIKELIIEKAEYYNCADFIKSDPIQIPHQFSGKEDIEIAAFITDRKSVV